MNKQRVLRQSWCNETLLALTAVMLASEASAETHIALPAPPISAIGEPGKDLRFDRGRTQSENALSRAEIVRSIQELQHRLLELDKSSVEELKIGHRPGTQSNLNARETLVGKLKSWSDALRRFDAETQCNPVDMTQHVEIYDGSLGPTREFVAAHQASTARIQWNDDFPRLGPQDRKGNVRGQAWCTGTLISNSYMLTAGHCFDIQSENWKTPTKLKHGQQVPLSPSALAPLMHVQFNYQLNATSGELREPDVYPIKKLLEHRRGGFDYAVVELGVGQDGKLPSVKFGSQKVDSTNATLSKAQVLTLIQHPNGRPKVIGAGSKLAIDKGNIYYSDIDTLGGSSGAGIVDQDGSLIGVHTTGGCTGAGGANFGVSAAALRSVSKIIR